MADARLAIARSFGRAAASYDAASQVQRLAARRLLQRLATCQPVADWALDLGCATAPAASELMQLLPTTRWLGVDLALPMLQQAQTLGRCSTAYRLVCADAMRLPFADAALDLIFSSFALQWTQPPAVLAELARLLASGGLLAISLPLAGSLAEIKACWAEVDGQTHVNALAAQQDWLEAAAAAGLEVVSQGCWQWRDYAPDVRTQLARIKASGAQHQLQASAGLASPRRLAAFASAYERLREPDGLPLTWQVLELILRKS